MKIGIILGTRPEIIKMSPIIDEIIKQNEELLLIHTGQHYDSNMSNNIFDDLNLPKPTFNLHVGSGTHGTQTSLMIQKIEKILLEEKPDVVLVQGDTNAVISGALVCAKLHIPLGHVEAGLRSYDNTMPEEINRKVADICSTMFFVPTEESGLNLLNENISRKDIYITGNTIVDTCFCNLKIAENTYDESLEKIEQMNNKIMLTVHRAETVDNKERLKNIIESIIQLKEYNIIFPVHPRTLKKLKEFDLYKLIEFREHIHIIPPLSYLKFLKIMNKSKLILTDSGGLQEEAITLNIPVLTLRNNTERPETVKSGGNILVGNDKEKIIKYSLKILKNEEFNNKMKNTKNPYGDGTSAKQIIEIIKNKYDKHTLKIESPTDISREYTIMLKNIEENINVLDYEKKYNTIIKSIFKDETLLYPYDNTNLKNSVIICKKEIKE